MLLKRLEKCFFLAIAPQHLLNVYECCRMLQNDWEKSLKTYHCTFLKYYESIYLCFFYEITAVFFIRAIKRKKTFMNYTKCFKNDLEMFCNKHFAVAFCDIWHVVVSNSD